MLDMVINCFLSLLFAKTYHCVCIGCGNHQQLVVQMYDPQVPWPWFSLSSSCKHTMTGQSLTQRMTIYLGPIKWIPTQVCLILVLHSVKHHNYKQDARPITMTFSYLSIFNIGWNYFLYYQVFLSKHFPFLVYLANYNNIH